MFFSLKCLYLRFELMFFRLVRQYSLCCLICISYSWVWLVYNKLLPILCVNLFMYLCNMLVYGFISTVYNFVNVAHRDWANKYFDYNAHSIYFICCYMFSVILIHFGVFYSCFLTGYFLLFLLAFHKLRVLNLLIRRWGVFMDIGW